MAINKEEKKNCDVTTTSTKIDVNEWIKHLTLKQVRFTPAQLRTREGEKQFPPTKCYQTPPSYSFTHQIHHTTRNLDDKAKNCFFFFFFLGWVSVEGVAEKMKKFERMRLDLCAHSTSYTPLFLRQLCDQNYPVYISLAATYLRPLVLREANFVYGVIK